MNNYLKFLFIAGGVSLVVIPVGLVLYLQSVLNQVVQEEQTEITIDEEDSWSHVVQTLQQEGLVTATYGASLYPWARGFSVTSGTYTIRRPMTIQQALDRIDKGPREKREEVQVTIPEGFDTYQIAEKMSQNLEFSEQEFLQELEDFPQENYDFVEGESLEGYLFPDTYRFFADSKPQEVIHRLLMTFDSKALSSLESVKGLSRYETLILASIVQKEVQTLEDKEKAAGVFLNRLDIDMPLQSDATVNYVVREGRAQATYQDLDIDSPYNSYQESGLPPTPIANPGKKALQATVDYADHEYYFFLTTRENPPRTIFSETHQEHVQARNQYLD